MSYKIPLDQLVTIEITDDKLTARLKFIQDDADFQCTVEDLEELLKRSGVKFGIKFNTLSAIATEARKFVYNQVTVANGIPATEGEVGIINVKFVLQGDRRPSVSDGGVVDYKEVINLNNVRKGQLIAERIPAKEGTDGRSVTGEIIAGKKGKEARFKVGKNVVLDQEQLRMYAAMDGLITMTDKDKINVFPVYEVNGDVDYNVGNIDFVGTVVIRGNVLTGFRIKAAGDIRIVGGVEGAELIADGSVDISAGILGFNKGLVKARMNVRSSFIQDANVEAGNEVIVTQSIMHSTVRAGKNVICQGSKGLIVGGVIQAGEQVKARVIGNSTSTATIIEVGVLPELRNELVELRAKIKEHLENADKTNKALSLLDQLALAGQLSPDKLLMRNRLSSTKKQSIDELNEVKDRILEIEKSLEDTTSSRVEITGTIFGGSKIVIGRYTRFIKDATQRVNFQMINGEIAMISK
ncbi:MAG: FapA family protein [Paenibacillaceae bacterium]